MAFAQCCWKPLSKKSATLVRVTERLTGVMSVKPKGGVSLVHQEQSVPIKDIWLYTLEKKL
jgi:hypothetical protein